MLKSKLLILSLFFLTYFIYAIYSEDFDKNQAEAKKIFVRRMLEMSTTQVTLQI